MKDWKNTLLATEHFLDNEYLEEYIILIESSHRVETYMENHHVIPVALYKQKYNLNTSRNRHEAERYANADPQNKTVLLTFSDHCKAHWLLTKCTTKELAESSAIAFSRQIAGLKKLDNKFILSKKSSTVDLGLTEFEYAHLQQYMNDIKTNNPRFWSPEQDDWLKKNRYLYTAKQCAEYLGKTEKAVLCRSTLLGLKKVWYSEEDNAALIKYSETHTAKECAEHFKTSEHNIIKRWRNLGFSKTFKWDNEKDNWLRENDSKYTVAELAERLGTSKTTVMGRRWTLGITRWDRTN